VNVTDVMLSADGYVACSSSHLTDFSAGFNFSTLLNDLLNRGGSGSGGSGSGSGSGGSSGGFDWSKWSAWASGASEAASSANAWNVANASFSDLRTRFDDALRSGGAPGSASYGKALLRAGSQLLRAAVANRSASTSSDDLPEVETISNGTVCKFKALPAASAAQSVLVRVAEALIALPPLALGRNDTMVSAAFARVNPYRPAHTNVSAVIASGILSVTVTDANATEIAVSGLARPINFSLPLNFMGSAPAGSSFVPACVWWNAAAMDWSSEGATAVGWRLAADGFINCSVVHLTDFAAAVYTSSTSSGSSGGSGASPAPTSPSASGSASGSGALIGGVVGGIAALAVVAAIVVVVFRRRAASGTPRRSSSVVTRNPSPPRQAADGAFQHRNPHPHAFGPTGSAV
jgi:hypothetical protein